MKPTEAQERAIRRFFMEAAKHMYVEGATMSEKRIEFVKREAREGGSRRVELELVITPTEAQLVAYNEQGKGAPIFTLFTDGTCMDSTHIPHYFGFQTERDGTIKRS